MMGGPMMMGNGPMMMGGMGMSPQMMMGGMGGMGGMGMQQQYRPVQMQPAHAQVRTQQLPPQQQQQQGPSIEVINEVAAAQPKTAESVTKDVRVLVALLLCSFLFSRVSSFRRLTFLLSFLSSLFSLLSLLSISSRHHQPPLCHHLTQQEGTTSSDMTETRAMTREMVRVLSQDPKFQNSEFLGFMEQVSRGEVEFSGNALKSGDVKTMEEAAQEAAAEGSLAKEGEVKGEQDMEARLAEAWKDTMAGKEVDLDAIWNEAIASGQDFDSMGSMFGNGMMNGGMGLQQNMQRQKDVYSLPEENKYHGSDNLFDVGMQKFQEGAIADAIAAFQAFVESETDDPSEGWRMLGLSHQEHDEDRKAIQCLEKSVEEGKKKKKFVVVVVVLVNVSNFVLTTSL